MSGDGGRKRKKELTKVRPVIDYGAAAWQPWISDTNVKSIERANQKVLRMVTGQSVGTPVESIRAKAGVPNYATIRKIHILTAKEKALRSSVDSNRNINQRLNRQGL